MTQKRAERTRQRLLEAAATEFAHHGYGGTSLMRVSRAAGVTMGALAFHFSSKIDLANAVCARGAAATRSAVALADQPGKPPLQAVIDITHALARLLRDDPAVRASGRLSQESLTGLVNWTDSWMPRVRRLLEQAAQESILQPHAGPELVAVLVRYVVLGLEMGTLAGCRRHLCRVTAIWDVMLPGIANVTQGLRPGGTPAGTRFGYS